MGMWCTRASVLISAPRQGEPALSGEGVMGLKSRQRALQHCTIFVDLYLQL